MDAKNQRGAVKSHEWHQLASFELHQPLLFRVFFIPQRSVEFNVVEQVALQEADVCEGLLAHEFPSRADGAATTEGAELQLKSVLAVVDWEALPSQLLRDLQHWVRGVAWFGDVFRLFANHGVVEDAIAHLWWEICEGRHGR